jgi:16S rRNA (guanine527-N7)-methyltransferase
LTDDPAAAARLARGHLERLLADPQARALAAVLPPELVNALEQYVMLLLEANRAVNLTRIVDPRMVAQSHLLDALAALPLVDETAASEAVDLGSGGGVPAVPLALARPDVAWTLVESIGKKAAILRDMVATLSLGNVSVVAERAETLGRAPAHRERYGLATARACAAMPVLVEYALPLLRTGGMLIAWKGPLAASDDEMRRGRVAAGQLGGGRAELRESGLAVLGGHRFALVHKDRPAPDRFPRRPGEPARRPLG